MYEWNDNYFFTICCIIIVVSFAWVAYIYFDDEYRGIDAEWSATFTSPETFWNINR